MKRIFLVFHLALLASMCIISYSSFADPVGDCAGTPADAIVDLPAPLNAWGDIACTPYGHILSNKEGWTWSYPGTYAPVFVPSQMVQNNPAVLGNKSYFTAIKMTKVEGKEFEAAYSAFHSGLEKDELIPVGFRLDVKSISGKSLMLYFFDYGDSAWGIWCPGMCDQKSRFMVMNMAKRTNITPQSDVPQEVHP